MSVGDGKRGEDKVQQKNKDKKGKRERYTYTQRVAAYREKERDILEKEREKELKREGMFTVYFQTSSCDHIINYKH